MSDSRFRRVGQVMGGMLLFLLPSAFCVGFHEEFAGPKLLVLVALGGPAYFCLGLSTRRDGDPLIHWRRLFALTLPLLLAVSWFIDRSHPNDLLPWIILAVTPLIFLEIGAAWGTEAGARTRLLSLLLFSAVPTLLIGLLVRHTDLFAFIPERADAGFVATVGNANELAEYAGPLALCALPLFALVTRPWVRAFVVVLGLAATSLVVLSDSRAGLLALGVGLLAFAGIVLQQRIPAKKLACSILAILLVGLIAVFAIPSTSERIATIADSTHPTNLVRTGLWQSTWDMAGQHAPLGVGVGRYEASFPRFRDAREWGLSGEASLAESPHQEFLWVWAEGGILGVIAAIAALILCFFALRGAFKDEDQEVRLFAAGTFAVLMAYGVFLCVRSPLHHPLGVMVPAALIGACAALRRTPLSRHRISAAIGHALVGVALIGALFVLRESRLVYLARWQEVEFADAWKSFRSGGNTQSLQVAFNEAHLTADYLDRLRSMGPISTHRAYRSSLIMRNLAATHQAFSEPNMARLVEAKGLSSRIEALPTFKEVEELLTEILARFPLHHEAQLLLAEVKEERANAARGDGSADEAKALSAEGRAILSDYLKSVPQAPKMRVALARLHIIRGEIGEAMVHLEAEERVRPELTRSFWLAKGRASLLLGIDAKTFGLFWSSRPDRTLAPAESEHLQRAREQMQAKAWKSARSAALIHLAQHPTAMEALSIISESSFKLDPPSEYDLTVGTKATARLKLLQAYISEETDDPRGFRRNLRLALLKDPDLLDAWWQEARRAGQDGELSKIKEALREMRIRKVSDAKLRLLVESEPALKAYREELISFFSS